MPAGTLTGKRQTGHTLYNIMEKDAIFTRVKEIIASEFELDPDLISPEKRWDEDLGLDSLDAVDLILSLGDHIGEKIDPALFKDARTLQDMVDLLQPFWKLK